MELARPYIAPRFFIISILIAVLSFPNRISAWPRGAPLEACDSMEPSQIKHGPSLVDINETVPYRIIPSSDKISSGEPVTVRIDGGPYKGFMLQARSMFTDERVGQFIDPPEGTKLLNCSGANAITHDGSKSILQGLEYTWISPDMSAGTVNFIATVVKEKTHYYKKIKSDPLIP